MLVKVIKYAGCQKIEVHLNNFMIITFQNFKEMYLTHCILGNFSCFFASADFFQN